MTFSILFYFSLLVNFKNNPEKRGDCSFLVGILPGSNKSFKNPNFYPETRTVINIHHRELEYNYTC